MVIVSPACENTFATAVSTGKPLSCGVIKRGLAIALAKLSRPPVEVMVAIGSVSGS